ncbi:CGNR zinc finger domain-containing protein [Mycolicibacterium fluoranthenivorans]|uniref:Putative RNA-binding Zn ribbon-like protein n=1 Tax=Mycolicibacterium fluoranthenivorans TaxID=258505 RepID=A0A7X5U2X0_9MYCO|nr:ABATE domain-containing protein [Mycolicibacterium fluoranthenivorans]MCV7354025.1 ABATE domain-containing protein [Mycolicibacterium fluoranthenivorans]NIH97415.1 putative RNA-binding Zn ribbon-like protein [Mycolicibacterium fluoranthenivorans]
MREPSRLDSAQALGFPVADEPLAVDLADTLITATDPTTDLLADEATCRRWWDLQRDRLPEGTGIPSLSATTELRQAVRDILDAHVGGTAPRQTSIDRVNVAAGGVASTRKLVRTDSGWASETTLVTPDEPHQLALAAVAESLIEILAGPTPHRLRRCANPTCSMLFLAQDARRRYCTQNICANRARAARHYRRHHH